MLQKQNLAICLFKETVNSISECVKDYTSFNPMSIKEEFQLVGEIIIGEQKQQEPSWVNFLREGVNEEIDSLENLSNRAIIITKIRGRYMGISFGYGFSMFENTKIEKNFGLKVVINTVNPKSLRSCESAKLDDNTILTHKQTSRSSSKTVFGSDLPSELLCGVSGKCSELILGTLISGKDQLQISPKITFLSLRDVLETSLNQYGKKDYLVNFDWYDNIKVEQDQDICEKLNLALISDLNKQIYDQINLACPEIYDGMEIEGFTFTPKGEIYPDLYFDDYLEYLKSSKKDDLLKIEDLKAHKIWVKYLHGEESNKWRLFDCLNYEAELDEKNYVLFRGDWYCIAVSYIENLNRYFESKLIPTNLPNARKEESEGDYNEKIGKDPNLKYICLDKNNITLKGLDPIEPCDLLSNNNELLHIKKKYSSAALSHLFSQGKVSGELLKQNKDFRKALRRKIQNIGNAKVDYNSIPINKVKSEEFKITFGIIDEKPGDLKIPFFSLVNFQSTGKYLETMGFDVKITKIECNAA